MNSRPKHDTTDLVSTELSPNLWDGLQLLWQAYTYAQNSDLDVWDFAVEIDEMRQAGLRNSEFRWLIAQGYAEHAQEITFPGDDLRTFRPLGKLTFAEGACFVLTEQGANLIRQTDGKSFALHDDIRTIPGAKGAQSGDNGDPQNRDGAELTCKPHWDPERKELRVGDVVVKHFKWMAVNQEAILAVFEEEGWPARIDDPLPPQLNQEPKRRLSDTIKCLNRKQKNKRIHFRGDGTGEGVTWELVGQDGSGDGPSG